MMRAGILALQGAFAEHRDMLESLGADCTEIRQRKDFREDLDALILPGGESTVMKKLLGELGLLNPIRKSIEDGMPVMGTCAGLILLAENVDGGEPCFGTMPVTVRRNAYGRQLGSFQTVEEVKGVGQFPMTFIRAPYIEKVREDVEILAVTEGNITAARYGSQLGLAFHPELTGDPGIHRYFIEEIC